MLSKKHGAVQGVPHQHSKPTFITNGVSSYMCDSKHDQAWLYLCANYIAARNPQML